jgi:hypothetical protein
VLTGTSIGDEAGVGVLTGEGSDVNVTQLLVEDSITTIKSLRSTSHPRSDHEWQQAIHSYLHYTFRDTVVNLVARGIVFL